MKKGLIVAAVLVLALAGLGWGLGPGGGARALGGVAVGAYHEAAAVASWPADNLVALTSKQKPVDFGAWMRYPENRWRLLNGRSHRSARLRQALTLELTIVGALLALLLFRPIWMLLRGFGRLKPGTTHGSAHFATDRELRGMRPQKGEAQLILGTVKGKPVALRESEQYYSALVIGPPAAGKSAGLIIPNLLAETGRRSLVISDLKGELVERTYAALSPHYRMWVLNLVSPNTSCGYNPLAHIYTHADAQTFAASWISNTGESTSEPYFDNAAKLLITAAVLHLNATIPGGGTLAHLHEFMVQDSNAVVDALKNSPAPAAKKTAVGFLGAVGLNDKLMGSIFSEMPIRFQIMHDERVAAVTSSNDVDFASMVNLDEKPAALYVVLDRALAQELKPIVACFFSQMFKELIGVAERSPGGVLPRGMFGYLDEMGNLGQIYNFPLWMSTVRSAKMGFMLAFQHSAQLTHLYEEEGKQIIMSCCNTKIALSKTSAEDAKWFSEQTDTTTVLGRNTGDSRKRGALLTESGNRGVSETSRALMTPGEVTRLPEDKMLVLSANRHPIVVTQRRWYKIPELRKLGSMTWNGQKVLPVGPAREKPLEPPVIDFSTALSIPGPAQTTQAAGFADGWGAPVSAAAAPQQGWNIVEEVPMAPSSASSWSSAGPWPDEAEHARTATTSYQGSSLADAWEDSAPEPVSIAGRRDGAAAKEKEPAEDEDLWQVDFDNDTNW